MSSDDLRRRGDGSPIGVLVTNTARASYRSLFDAVAGVTWLTPSDLTGADPAATLLDVDVAWLSVDLLYEPGGAAFVELVRTAPNLAWVQSSFAGTDLPAFSELLGRGVRLSTSHENAISIAEYVVGAVLGTTLRSREFARAQAERRWEHLEFDELFGSTWMIIGLGAIGTAIARRANAFGVRTIGVRRHPGPNDLATETITPDEILGRLPDASVVIVSRPASPAELPLVDATFLAAMAPSAIFVNVARGSLVDDDALLQALDRGTPSMAILDVFTREPLSDTSPYWSHPHVIVTPHASSGGRGRHRRNAQLFVANLARYLNGDEIAHEVTVTDLGDPAGAPAQFDLDPS